MFGANPIPEDEVDNSTSTSLSNSSTIIRPLTVDEDSKNGISFDVDAHISQNSSDIIFGNLSDTKSIEFLNISDNNIDAEIIKTTESHLVCAFYNPEFIIYSSLCSFYIPCIFMVFLYSRIFWVSIQNL